jgi:hypothetical protein
MELKSPRLKAGAGVRASGGAAYSPGETTMAKLRARADAEMTSAPAAAGARKEKQSKALQAILI